MSILRFRRFVINKLRKCKKADNLKQDNVLEGFINKNKNIIVIVPKNFLRIKVYYYLLLGVLLLGTLGYFLQMPPK